MASDELTRDRAMEGRVARTLGDAGVGGDGVALVIAAHRLAMEPRLAWLGDPHHPDFLHPGRTVLILVLDTALRDPSALAAAALVETEHAVLAVDPARVRAAVGDAVAELVAAVPVGGEGLAEALVTASHEVRLVGLAERLDQCRHAKFWSDRAAQLRILEQTHEIFGPIAERTDEGLARRFAHWAGAFGRSLERKG